MQEPSRPPADVQKLRRAKRSRDSLIKGTAILLLVIFAVTSIQQYFGPGAVVWLAGGIGLWLLLSAFTRGRSGHIPESGGFAASQLDNIEDMDREDFIQQASAVLQAQGYEVQAQRLPDDSATYLLLVRGDERALCVVEDNQVDESRIIAALEVLKKTDCPQAMILSPHKSSARVQTAALQHGVVLIDQDEFARLRSLQVKGHRVHAFRPGAGHQTYARMRRRRR